MTRRLQENVVALLVILIFAAAIYASLGYGPRARLVPIPIAVIGILLMLAQLYLQNSRSEQDLQIDLLEFISKKSTGAEDAVPTAAEGADEAASQPRKRDPRMEFAALGMVVLLIGMFFVVGPIPTMFLFTAGYFVLSRHYSPAWGVLYAFIGTLAVYALFYLWLGVDMRQGMVDLSFGMW
ncbi:tripartite tricarboxylate transporter TctB family protein [Faunimonas sp. B44]|uniref:tripartite tricarboxylate transporter TctB family protein n=1 Tax=Faunimonas sp. B44 TaxID=3461493 RepID=UPI0040447F6C